MRAGLMAILLLAGCQPPPPAVVAAPIAPDATVAQWQAAPPQARDQRLRAFAKYNAPGARGDQIDYLAAEVGACADHKTVDAKPGDNVTVAVLYRCWTDLGYKIP